MYMLNFGFPLKEKIRLFPLKFPKKNSDSVQFRANLEKNIRKLHLFSWNMITIMRESHFIEGISLNKRESFL